MAIHYNTLAWKIKWMEEPARLQSMGSQRVKHNWATSLFTFTHWRRKWQPSPLLTWRIPGMGEPSGLPSMGSYRVGHNWSDLAAAAAHASKVMFKILQARLQQYMNRELTDVQAGFRKGRGTRDQIANILWIIKKARKFQKNIYFCFIDYEKPLTVWITINCGKFWEMGIPGHLTCLFCVQIRKQQLELDMEQQTGSK